MLSGNKKNVNDSSNPWTEDPTEAYKNFLKYAGDEVNAGVNYNRQVLSLFAPPNKEKAELKVYAYNGTFYPLETATSMPLYCSKITIRNVEKANFRFVFGEDILPEILGIDAEVKTGKNLKIAYRNIVPSEFEHATQLAGPMGFKEYIIDGNNHKKNSIISFVANSEFKNTPIKIVLENCKGMAFVENLDEVSIKRIFENKCEEKELRFISLPKSDIENKKEIDKEPVPPRMRP